MSTSRSLRGVLRVAATLCAATFLMGALACGNKPEGQVAADLVSQGLTAHTEGKPAEAARHYRQALVHDPNNKFAIYNLGLIEQQAGRTLIAEQYYRHTLALDPAFSPALFNLAIILTPNKPRDAKTVYERLLKLEPRYAAAHMNLGFLLQSLDETSAGRRELDRAVELDPSLESRVGTGQSATPEPRPDN